MGDVISLPLTSVGPGCQPHVPAPSSSSHVRPGTRVTLTSCQTSSAKFISCLSYKGNLLPGLLSCRLSTQHRGHTSRSCRFSPSWPEWRMGEGVEKSWEVKRWGSLKVSPIKKVIVITTSEEKILFWLRASALTAVAGCNPEFYPRIMIRENDLRRLFADSSLLDHAWGSECWPNVRVSHRPPMTACDCQREGGMYE